jgi:ABC-type sugar transport system ATPase subunit
MLRIDGLKVDVGAFALAGIHLRVKEGECHAVLGPSGSGKSTLLNAVLGTVPVASGQVQLAGREITHLSMEHRRLGYVPQQLGLFPHLAVRDNLIYSARARKIPRCDFEPLLDRLVEITGIGSLLDRRPTTLSGGERQRVALVRALAADPKLVLLDEPFTALNESLRRELWWLVKDLQRERNLSVLLVTHDLAEAYFLAGRITVLIDGYQEQSGDREEVYRHPGSEAVARFLGLKNLFSARIVEPGVVDCPALGGRFTVAAADAVGEGVMLAIRAEHVVLRTVADQPRPDEHRLSGRFHEVIDLGEAALLHFRTDTGVLLEVRCGSRLLRKYGLKAGGIGLVGLPARDLFVVSV